MSRKCIEIKLFRKYVTAATISFQVIEGKSIATLVNIVNENT